MAHSPNSARPSIPTPAELAALPADGGEHWNRLVFEKSPYLLQHAANPVDWHPWRQEAFNLARELDKPVFLSVGYSTCHWCHVMEHESFEDETVAKALNEAFVCIKVDREERPDIDHVYMTVTQALTGHGGWPMTVIMTPEKKPFFAGTYFPKESRYGRPGVFDLIGHIKNLWTNDRTKAEEAADYISSELGKVAGATPGGALTEATLDRAFDLYSGNFDASLGGFGDRPKFPTPHNLSYLVRHHLRTGSPEARQMVVKTLHHMRLGGIFDQVGFGFHRYSTDAEWLVPHFEKMLYDQALMAIASVEAWQAFGTEEFLRTADEIFTYVLRDMTSPEGGFYSAEDADSEGEEGKFYVWSTDEVREVLGKEEGDFFAELFQFEEKGNFHEESTGQLMGTNIPHLAADLDAVAAKLGLEIPAFRARVEADRTLLFSRRKTRIHPLKDDKVLTDWNGLMIAAFAKAAKATGNARYLDAAARAADFALTVLRGPDGRLLKRARHGEAGLPAHLEDYAFLAWGLVELYEASFEEKYLIAALDLADQMLERFWDPAEHGFFHTASDAEKLIVRSKDIYDGAIPSGNSVAVLVLMRLGRMTANPRYEARASETILAFSGSVGKGPINHAQMLIALDFALAKGREVVLAGHRGEPTFAAMAATVRRQLKPGTVLVHRPSAEDSPLLQRVPALVGNKMVDGKSTAYVCHNFACAQPVTELAALEGLLAE